MQRNPLWTAREPSRAIVQSDCAKASLSYLRVQLQYNGEMCYRKYVHTKTPTHIPRIKYHLHGNQHDLKGQIHSHWHNKYTIRI